MNTEATAPIRTVWTYKVNGEVMGTYTEDYSRRMYDTLASLSPSSRVQLVRFDHYASDFATTGKNWTSVPTVAEDTHPEPTPEPQKKSTAIELLDPLRPCRRCKATGTFHLPNGPVQCRNCGGTGEVPSTRDRRRIEAANQNYHRLIKTMRTRAEERDGRRNGRIEFESHQGFGLLEQDEPHRLPALFQSLEAGRVDDVIDMLIAYRNPHPPSPPPRPGLPRPGPPIHRTSAPRGSPHERQPNRRFRLGESTPASRRHHARLHRAVRHLPHWTGPHR